MLAGVRLLFLDELHAHDPGDAMLLSRLVHALPSRGAVLVATSDYPPHGLLPDPRHDALVLPLVAALEQHFDVLELAGPVDLVLSAASAAQVKIKNGLGKLAVGDVLDLHRDPFDRLLVPQARVKGLTLVTADPHVQACEVSVLSSIRC